MKQDDINNHGRKILKNLQKNDKPKKTGWGPVSAILVTLGIYFGAQLLAAYIIIQYLFLTGKTRSNIPTTIDDSVILQFIFIAVAEVVSLLLLWWFLRRRKVSWQAIGLKRPTGKNLIYALPGYVIYFAIILATLALLQNFVPDIDVNQNQQVGFETAHGGLLVLVFIALVILPALVEEIMIRGFLYGGLRKKLPVITSAILASTIFGLAHLQLGSGDSPVWVAAVDTFILSMVLIWLREKTGNIWAGVVVHMAKNSLAFLTLFVFKGL